PNTMFDINSGTIAGTVTNCQVGPCAPCFQPNAIADLKNENEIALYPNPFSSQTQITIDPELVSVDGLVFVVVDIQGRTVREIPVSSATIHLDRGDLASGLFLYRLTANGQVYATGKMIVE
ncbi:MAG: T9SS type A sorting domain-containing protein, partial [Bacteroidia bacterium]